MTLLFPILGGLGIVLTFWGIVGSRSDLVDRVAPYVERPGGGSSSFHRVLRWLLHPLGALKEGRIDRRTLSAIALPATGAAVLALAGSPEGMTRALVGGAAGSVIGWTLHNSLVARRRRLRRQEIRDHLPTALDLLSIALSAGEAVGPALVRVGPYLSGALSDLLTEAAGHVQAGVPIGEALAELSEGEDEPALTHFVEVLTTALDRGTPVAATLQSHSYDLREEERRALLDAGGRREVLMLVPVVFLILPVVVLFVLYPGLVSLNMLVP